MADTEEYFPRGGKKPTVTHFKQNSNFLGSIEKGEKKKNKVKKKNDVDDGYLSDEAARIVVDQSFNNCAFGINYKTAKTDFLILGRIFKVYETKINVMMSGPMTGCVMACHISEAYNKLLEEYVNDKIESVKDLSSMFKVGQYVACKVLEAGASNLMLSMMPQHVNSVKSQTDLHKGALLQCAVSSVEDHGYVMDIGIPNVRAFLPTKHANPELELDVGMLTWCCVKSSSEGNVVTLSGDLSKLQTSMQKKGTVSSLLPGTAVDFVVDKPLENGIEGHLFDDITAYVQRQHVTKVKGKKPKIGQKLRCRVLYVMPTRNTPFLTMHEIFSSSVPDMQAEQLLNPGDIVEDAVVLKLSRRSVHFKLSDKGYGVLGFRRLVSDENLTDEEVVAKSYPIGSSHKVRVLCYNMLDYLYSVSDSVDIIKEKYFNVGNISPGDLVDGVVRNLEENKIIVNVGRITGIVPYAHIADTGIVLDIKKANASKLLKKFKEGQNVRARVLIVDENKNQLVLTLKPTLLAEDLEVLTSYEQAQVGKSYPGVIKFIGDYLLVTFFNKVTAIINKSQVSKEPIDNLKDAFHYGQIVNCTIIWVNPDTKKMTGSLVRLPFDPNQKQVKRKLNSDSNEPSQPKKAKLEKKTAEVHKDSKINKKQRISDQEINEKNNKKKDLADLTNCLTSNEWIKRVPALQKAIEEAKQHIESIEKDIERIETKGLNPKNKMQHTVMQANKLLAEEEMNKLTEALKFAEKKLKKIEKNSEATNTNTEDPEVRSNKRNHKEKLKSALDVPSAKDLWLDVKVPTKSTQNDDDYSSSEEEDKEISKKKRKKLTVAEKLAKAREEEERIRDLEKRAIESESSPASSEQFERALLASPDNSQLWIAYMAFHLQATEIDKARSVGQRALKTISFREEREKLNVWLALLNTENRFGSKESLQKTLEDALQMNEPLEVHSALLEMYAETGKVQELSQLIDLVLRKHKRVPDAYVRCGRAGFRAGLGDKARHAMQRALAVLDKQDHVSVLMQFALLERDNGNIERAEAIFEQIAAVYPQRVDVSSVYIDMMCKAGDVDRVRQVLERMTSQKLPARKMKILYKKWMEVEEKLGDVSHLEAIRQRAMEYIEKAKF